MGKIILIGGNVDLGTPLSSKERKEFGRIKKFRMVRLEILERMLLEMKGPDSRMEIVTAASQIPIAIGNEYKKALTKIRCRNINVLHFKTAKEADHPDNLDRLKKCDGLLFTGGNQSLLCKKLHNTRFLALLRKRYSLEKEFVVAGTSAGAMALAQIMIAAGKPSGSFVKGDIRVTEGLGLLTHLIIDTHFIQRRRLGRLIEAVAMYPDKLGIGLAEDTALFFKTPQKVEVIGNNIVVLIDGTQITFNNMRQVKKDQNICLQDVRLHILPKGYLFNIVTRKILKKKEVLRIRVR